MNIVSYLRAMLYARNQDNETKFKNVITEKTYNSPALLPPLDYPSNEFHVPGMDFNYDFRNVNK